MSRGTEFTGKSVEAATVEAEQALGKSRDQLEIQVLNQGSRGVFGLGGEPARIVTRDPAAMGEPSAAKPEPEPGGDVSESPLVEPRAPRPTRGRSERVERPEPAPRSATAVQTLPPEGVAAAALEIVEALMAKMGFDDVEVSARPGDDPVTLEIRGEDLGILIGRRGDSLASLQFMVNAILSKRFKSWPHVVIDVQGYRSRREETLTNLGQRVAERVRRNRRPFTLEAMPANDRRIIHLTLRDRQDVETYSVGEGQGRRVVIAPRRG